MASSTISDATTGATEGLGAALRCHRHRLHGQQEQRFFHGYYDSYCYLPLYVFCGQQLMCAYLRPSRIDAVQHSAAILKLLVRRLRQAWPAVRIFFRGDSGFCRQRLINWCERCIVHYMV